jgi:hypothetical protein
MKKLFSLGLAILLMASAGAFAQTATGNVFGVVTDASGAVLPGASVAISGEAGTRTTVSGSDGSFRFLNMDYGDYTVTVSMQGFGAANRKITVVTGSANQVNVSLKIGGQTETIEVTAEAPLVDAKKRGTTTTLATSDLKDTPNSRDPWGIMNQVPGALIDRVNIAGNENGQQAAVAGKGSTSGDRVWSLDGLVITDMAATGASPTYFDFDAFQEINVTTGGGDLTMQTGGFGMNLVTKRGTNSFHGGGRFFASDKKYESSNIADRKAGILLGNANRLQGGVDYCNPGAGVERDKANYIDSIKDYGFDLGGPIVKDKLWFYGTWGKQDIKLCGLAGSPDATLLPAYNIKLNWQASSNTMISAFYFLGSKQKFGRSPGTGYVEADGILWNQDNAFTDGGLPGGLWKLEVNHTFSPSFFMSAKAAYYDTGFGLIARGDHTKSYTYNDAAGTVDGTYIDYLSIRPQKTVNVDGSYFVAGMGGNHELKFGFSYRDVVTNSSTKYNGNGIYGNWSGPGTGGGDNLATIARNGIVQYGGKYSSAYVGDVFTKNRLTFNIGARLDMQKARNLPSEAPANVSFPALLPALKYGGNDKDIISWTDISPRVGMSYGLDEARKTVLRASFARYASQLSYGNVTTANPVADSGLVYGWNDLNGDKVVQPNEVVLSNFVTSFNVDPNNPAKVGSTPNAIDTNLSSKKDNEFVVGLDHEIGSNFAIGGALTYRKTTNPDYTPRLAAPCPTSTNCSILTPANYTPNAVVTAIRNGETFTAQTYSPNAALVAAGGGGRYRTNCTFCTFQYKGAEITINKRMSNKWRARVSFSLNDWTQGFSATPAGSNGNPTHTDTNPNQDGGQVSISGGGSGKAAFYSSYKWQVFASAGFSLPASFDLSASFFGRQGGLLPVILRVAAGGDGTQNALATGPVDARRYPTLYNLDLRLARNSKIGTKVTVSPSIEVFNVLNNDVILGQFRQATSASFGRVDDIVSPRILRIGARLTF